ncbi:aldo/keto reductase [Roseivirga misakiensis]|uniref:Oxidoreductase n=1 Tax=Roseivirga misakiensis TaxID=1563681 RepID=A0A1E5SKX3_9BACT|nr:aldo/keto reductase [Roseivirga misakiensis]OEJ99774.1 oxidoreductase [Roseivirga misakiensis]
MEQVKLSDKVSISAIVHGMWRLPEWNLSPNQIVEFVEKCIELGIDTFDHADIYGDYMVEEMFGNAMSQSAALNQNIKVVTKCGIKLRSNQKPEHYIQHYDTSYDHIIASVENSLTKLKRDNIDVLLIHRPSPLSNPEEMAEAFAKLRAEGKVLEFGVSNYLPHQFDALQAHMDFPLVTNQVEISVAALQEFENGAISLCQEIGIPPMAWSPLAGGSIFKGETHRFLTIKNVLHKISDQFGVSIDQIMYAWLLKHPSNIIPIVGSGKIERVQSAVNALNIDLTTQQWFELWVASKGENVP